MRSFGLFWVWLLLAVPVLAQTTPPLTDPPTEPIRKFDIVRVTVVGEPNYSGEFRVDELGTISLPRIGQVLVANNPTQRAARFVEERLKGSKYLKEPNVVIQILQRKPREVTINGAVQVQGRRVLREGARLSDVLEEAVPSVLADLEHVQLTRGSAPLVINYKKYRNGLEDTETVNPLVEEGDRIYVRLGEPTEGTVKVIGEVKDPTKPTVQIASGATVGQVLGLVGGLTELSNRKGIFLMRGPLRIEVPYEAILAGQSEKDIRLQDKDEIHVPRLEKPRQYTVYGGVQTRGPFPLQGKVTVLQAVANAAPLEGVKRKEILLSRLDSTGNLPERALKLNLENPREAGMEIQDGDVLFVPVAGKSPKFDFGQLLGLAGNLLWIGTLLRG